MNNMHSKDHCCSNCRHWKKKEFCNENEGICTSCMIETLLNNYPIRRRVSEIGYLVTREYFSCDQYEIIRDCKCRFCIESETMHKY